MSARARALAIRSTMEWSAPPVAPAERLGQGGDDIEALGQPTDQSVNALNRKLFVRQLHHQRHDQVVGAGLVGVQGSPLRLVRQRDLVAVVTVGQHHRGR